MKRIGEFRKHLGVDKNVALSDLKLIYRKMMKEHHPDKFPLDSDERLAAEEKSKVIIEAYHFLVSIAPETVALELPEYTETTADAGITEILYVNRILEVKFTNGSSYEYFGVTRDTYEKFATAPSPARFARRHIYTSYTYRKATKSDLVPA